jgi:hypothetical protein
MTMMHHSFYEMSYWVSSIVLFFVDLSLTLSHCTISAAVALLGKRTGDGGYIKGDECLDCLKDLQQFLQRDDPVGDNDETFDGRGERKHPWELHRFSFTGL